MVEAIVRGHNVKSDIDMINAKPARHRVPILKKFNADVFDTMPKRRECWPCKLAGLDALCERVGVSTTHREKHGTLINAILCAEAPRGMHREQRSFLELFAETAPAVALNEHITEMPAVLVVPASADELAAHASYLAGMSGDTPIWHSYTPGSAHERRSGRREDETAGAERALAPC